MVTLRLPYMEELQMLLLRFAMTLCKHNEHQPTPWKMRARYLPFLFKLCSSSEFN